MTDEMLNKIEKWLKKKKEENLTSSSDTNCVVNEQGKDP